MAVDRPLHTRHNMEEHSVVEKSISGGNETGSHSQRLKYMFGDHVRGICLGHGVVVCVDIDWVVKTATLRSEGLNHEFVTAALGSVVLLFLADQKRKSAQVACKNELHPEEGPAAQWVFPSNFDMTSGIHVALLKSGKIRFEGGKGEGEERERSVGPDPSVAFLTRPWFP